MRFCLNHQKQTLLSDTKNPNLYTFSYLTVMSRYCMSRYYPHLTGKETEAMKLDCSRFSSMWQSQDLKQELSHSQTHAISTTS